jgi:hypothetical protein
MRSGDLWVKVWRKGLEGPYRLEISIREHRYDMFFSTDINSGRVRVDQRQALQMNSLTTYCPKEQ